MADAWKDMQPKIELNKWPDVAHWPMIDVPDRVAKVILDRHLPSGPELYKIRPASGR